MYHLDSFARQRNPSQSDVPVIRFWNLQLHWYLSFICWNLELSFNIILGFYKSLASVYVRFGVNVVFLYVYIYMVSFLLGLCKQKKL